jgi:hypothetical protein
VSKWVVRVVISFAWMFLVVGSTPAHADAVTGWDIWRAPEGTICVQHTDAAVAAAAWRWSSMTDVTMTTKASCEGYARSLTVKFWSKNEPDNKWCSRYNANGWAWQYVRGDWVWTPKYPTIEVNVATVWHSKCQNSWDMKLHLYGHELGHYLGLSHNLDKSIMCEGAACGWEYTEPQEIDKVRTNEKY